MDDARAEEFFDWMVTMRVARGDIRPNDNSIRRYIKELLKVERAKGSDLDEIFRQGQLRELWENCEYKAADARANWDLNARRPDPTGMGIHPALLLRDLPKFRSRIKQYLEFCVAHPPAPIEAE